MLILDEPSAILTDAEIEVLFGGVIRRLTESGVSVIYISHRLDELFRIADEVTVMRDGTTVATKPIGELTVRQIAELMVGGLITEEREGARAGGGRPRCRCAGSRVRAGSKASIWMSRPARSSRLWPHWFRRVRYRGCGVRHGGDHRGTVSLFGKETRIRDPRVAKRLGVSMLPSNRSAQGSFAFQSIAFNITVGSLRSLGRLPGGCRVGARTRWPSTS